MTIYNRSISGKYLIAWGGSILCLICYNLSVDWLTENSHFIFLLSFIVLGMPHGMVDALLLFRNADLNLNNKKNSNVWLIIVYVVLSLSYGLLWMILPHVALSLFLLLTAFHWGSTEFGERAKSVAYWYQLGLTRGGVIVASTFAFHHEQTVEALKYFDYNLPQKALLYIWIICFFYHILLLTMASIKFKKTLLVPLIDLIFLSLLLAFTPVLLGISVYYTLFHSIRFYSWFVQNNEKGFDRKSLLINSHLLSFILFSVTIILIYFLKKSGGSNIMDISSNLLPMHLMLLAVLTLPHSILAFTLQSGRSKVVKPDSIL